MNLFFVLFVGVGALVAGDVTPTDDKPFPFSDLTEPEAL